MFTKKITDSDAFIELSSSTQALYFHLNQGADDDGFNNQVQNAMFKAHASVDDLKVLLMKNFIIQFESGVIVIKHWRMHNTLRKDRYTPTNFQEELKNLDLKDNGSYTLQNNGCQVVAKRLPQDSIGKDSIGKDSIDIDIVECEVVKETPTHICKKIIDYLNKKTNANFRSNTNSTMQKIKARLNEGYVLDDFIVVIDKKCGEWLNDDKMNKYLRPETLFGTKFESYLNQPMKKKTTKDIPIDISDF